MQRGKGEYFKVFKSKLGTTSDICETEVLFKLQRLKERDGERQRERERERILVGLKMS